MVSSVRQRRDIQHEKREEREVCDGNFKESGEGRKAPGEMTFEQRLGESGGFWGEYSRQRELPVQRPW